MPFRATRTVTSEDACAVHHQNTRCRRALKNCLSQDRRFAEGTAPSSVGSGRSPLKIQEAGQRRQGHDRQSQRCRLGLAGTYHRLTDQTADPNEFLNSPRSRSRSRSAQKAYVFTPHGKVIGFPTGETPVDFAYAVHTEVGNRITGSKVTAGLSRSIAHSAAAATSSSSRYSPPGIRMPSQARLIWNPSQADNKRKIVKQVEQSFEHAHRVVNRTHGRCSRDIRHAGNPCWATVTINGHVFRKLEVHRSVRESG